MARIHQLLLEGSAAAGAAFQSETVVLAVHVLCWCQKLSEFQTRPDVEMSLENGKLGDLHSTEQNLANQLAIHREELAICRSTLDRSDWRSSPRQMPPESQQRSVTLHLHAIRWRCCSCFCSCCHGRCRRCCCCCCYSAFALDGHLQPPFQIRHANLASCCRSDMDQRESFAAGPCRNSSCNPDRGIQSRLVGRSWLPVLNTKITQLHTANSKLWLPTCDLKRQETSM